MKNAFLLGLHGFLAVQWIPAALPAPAECLAPADRPNIVTSLSTSLANSSCPTWGTPRCARRTSIDLLPRVPGSPNSWPGRAFAHRPAARYSRASTPATVGRVKK